jgi:DNA helicase-2/ATP-dependent DNA helicase PcrA
LEKGVDPRRILLVTFTVKAARQMLERVERIVGHRPENLWGGTFHHIGNVLLRRHAELIRRTPAFGILDEEDSKDLIAACIADLKILPGKTRLPQANVLENLFSLSANTLRPLETLVPENCPQFSDQVPFIQQVFAAYKKRKEQGNLLDYDDLLTLWLEVLKNHPSVRKSYGEQFQHILVDEYQDTNRLQFEIIRAMTGPHRNLLVVGDDAQSIYAFRGAEVANLLTFNRFAALPTRNFREATFEDAHALSGEALNAARRVARRSCAACTIGCEHI